MSTWTTEEAVRNALSPFYSDEIRSSLAVRERLSLLVDRLRYDTDPPEGIVRISAIVQENAPDLLDFYPLSDLHEADAIRDFYNPSDQVDFFDLLSLNPLAAENPGFWYSAAVEGQNTARALRRLRLMFFLNPNANEALLKLMEPPSFFGNVQQRLRNEINQILAVPFLSDTVVTFHHPERRAQLLEWLAGYMAETGRPRTAAALLSVLGEARQPEDLSKEQVNAARAKLFLGKPPLSEECPLASPEEFMSPLKIIFSLIGAHRRRIAERALGLLDDLLLIDPPATPLQYLATTMSLVRSLERALGIAPQSYFLDRVL